ncbi:MAG: hypothetical protein AAF211_00075 [Myxococcota bacterium]
MTGRTRVQAKHVLRVVAFVVLCSGLAWATGGLKVDLDPSALRPADPAERPGLVAAYLVFWIVSNSVLWPTLAGGVLFGAAHGALLSIVAAALAAALQLLVIRSFLREPAEAWFGERIQPVRAALEARSLGVILVWRLLWMPVPLLTVGTALTRIPAWQHVAGVVAMVPGIVALSYTADGLLEHGLWALPADRLALLTGAFGGSLLVYAAAQHRWPALRVSRWSTHDS